MGATTAEILEAHRRGDPSALETLVAHCQSRIEFLARKLLRNHPRVRRWEETADVAQESLLRLHAGLRATKPESEAHLFRLAALQVRREFIDLVRHYDGPRSPMGRLETNVWGAGDEPVMRVDLAENGDRDSPTAMDRWSRFHAAVGELPDDEQEVFQMVWYLGADQRTIAAMSGCSIRTIKRRWKEAVARIKELLGEDHPR
jgi:RNA polymerase sigma factor (sigma-70 family)